MERLQITTLTTQNITSALLAATYTADAVRELLVQVYASGLAGDGAYRACLTKQIAGAGSAYQSPTAVINVSSGATTVFLPLLPMPVNSGDVVKVYVQGLGTDSSVGLKVEVFDSTPAGAAAVADAVWDEAIGGHTTGTTFGGKLQTAVSTAPTAASIADAVWDETAGDHATTGTTGKVLSDNAGAVWNAVAAGYDTTGSMGELLNNAGGGGVTVNTYLAVSAAQAASVASGSLAIRTYHTFGQAITSTSTAALNTATKLWLAIKETDTDADASSLIFLSAAGGLSVLAKAAYATTGNGTLVVSGSSGAWTITVGIDEAATALLAAYVGGSYPAELKALVSGNTVSLWEGYADISQGIVRTYS